MAISGLVFYARHQIHVSWDRVGTGSFTKIPYSSCIIFTASGYVVTTEEIKK